MTTLNKKVTQLRDLLASFNNVVVCFSGGVDSTYLLSEAVQVLGQRAIALTAISPSLAPEEGDAVQTLAATIGARLVLVDTYELDDPRYADNPVNRCYFCKTEVYSQAVKKRRNSASDKSSTGSTSMTAVITARVTMPRRSRVSGLLLMK